MFERRAAERVKLTQRVVESLKTTNPRGAKCYDTATQGFCVIVYPSGRKVFWVRYSRTPHGRPDQWMKVGVYGVLTVDQARERAQELLSKATLGQNPAAEEAAKRAMPTVSEWALEYLENIKDRKKSYVEDARYLGAEREQGQEPYAVAARVLWDKKPLDSLTVEDIEAGFKLAKEHGRITANRWLASVRACLQAAWRRGIIPSNPAMRVRPLHENAPRDRVLSNNEMTRLWNAIQKEADPHVRAAFILMVETGARRSEVLRASMADFDLKAARWKLPETKAGKPQFVPLTSTAVQALRRLPRLGPWLLPGQDPTKHRVDLKDPWARLLAAAELSNGIHIHDIRRTFGLQVAIDHGIHAASKLLRHSDIRVTSSAYAPLVEDELRKRTEETSRKRAKILKFRKKAGGAR